MPGTKVDIDPDTGAMKRMSGDTRTNPYDLFALETALQIREKTGGAAIGDGEKWIFVCHHWIKIDLIWRPKMNTIIELMLRISNRNALRFYHKDTNTFDGWPVSDKTYEELRKLNMGAKYETDDGHY